MSLEYQYTPITNKETLEIIALLENINFKDIEHKAKGKFKAKHPHLIAALDKETLIKLTVKSIQNGIKYECGLIKE